jgi:hypothetical protein
VKRHLLFWLLCLLSFTSVAQNTDTAGLSVTYQYVNASSLTLRALPKPTATPIATITGASRVEVLAERPDGWSQVHVEEYVGYVKSDYLVDEQQAVMAESVDWSLVRALGGTAYAQTSAVEAAPVVRNTSAPARRAAPKQSAGPKVYICNNGRTEVFHSSEDCSAMRRCTYTTKVASASEARGSGLRECMKCF